MGRIAAFIEWHLFSPTLHKCSEQNRQGSSWGRHFLRLRWQWQTCSNYFKSKQTPRKLPFLLSFVTSFLQAASGFFMFIGCDVCLCVCVFSVSTLKLMRSDTILLYINTVYTVNTTSMTVCHSCPLTKWTPNSPACSHSQWQFSKQLLTKL